jgi:hypothetical protein
VSYAGLRDAILSVMGNGRDWELSDIIVAVERTGVITANDRKQPLAIRIIRVARLIPAQP